MTSDLSFTQSASVLQKIDSPNFEEIRAKAKELKLRSIEELIEKTKETGQPISSITARVRFIGQEHTLSVPFLDDDSSQSLFKRFTKLHQERFGHSFSLEAEIVSFIVKLTLQKEKPDLSRALISSSELAFAESHEMFDDAKMVFVETEKIPSKNLELGKNYFGPCLIYDEGSSMPILKGQVLSIDERGIITLRRSEVKNGKD